MTATPNQSPAVSPRQPQVGEPPRPRIRWRQIGLALALFLATLFTTTTLGAIWYLQTRTDVVTDLDLVVSFRALQTVWTEPALWKAGLTFSVPALLILLCHELGHFYACRIHNLQTTPPYFLPLPAGLGTLGAFIRIRSPIRDRRQLLDVGAAGPVAGFIVLIPFLLYGIAHSSPHSVMLLDSHLPGSLALLLPGKSLAIQAVIRLFHGDLGPGVYLNLHPFALAAWLGLFATALNLIPVGQLDGGHIVYAVSQRIHRYLRFGIAIVLIFLGSLAWPGWLLWLVILLAVGLKHPPVGNPDERLNPARMVVALFSLLIFLVAFMPVPFSLLPIAG